MYIRGCRIAAIMLAFQAGDGGSIPPTRSMENNAIELIARAVIVHDDNVLLCRSKGKQSYFFPGGHVEFKEDIVSALVREIGEEVGGELRSPTFIGVLENSFLQHNGVKHEVNIVFSASLVSPDIKNLEDHIECMWVPVDEFKKGSVLPVLLKEKVTQWMRDRQIFFGSEEDGKLHSNLFLHALI